MALLAVAGLLGANKVLVARWVQPHAGRWLGLAALVAAYELWILWRGLATNHRSGEQDLLPSLGAGTLMSYVRGVLLAGTAGFLFSPRPPGILAWAPMALFTLAAILDYFDGYLARRTDHVTALGEAYDQELDGLGMLVGSGLAVWYGVLPHYYLVIGLASYLFRLGIWIRTHTHRPVRALPPSTSRRPVAGLMMGFLSAMLWPIVSPPATTLAGLFFLVPFLGSFTRDWLVVSDVVDPQGTRYTNLRSGAKAILLEWVPLPFRLIVVSTLTAQNAIAFSSRAMQFEPAGFPRIGALFALTEMTLGILIGLGVAGRAAAFLSLFPVGLSIVILGQDVVRNVTLAACLTILVLGTGRYSLWKPVEAFFSRRAGEARA